jgi:hypothetical protein
LDEKAVPKEAVAEPAKTEIATNTKPILAKSVKPDEISDKAQTDKD